VTPPETILHVRVKPNAKSSRLLGRHGDAIKIAIRAAPERGRANAEVIAILSKALQVPATALELLAGATSPDKRIRIHGLDAAQVDQRITAALEA
jgi:hypothetical protein